MSKRSSQARAAILVAGVASICLYAQSAGYLAMIGPVPLRFELAKINVKPFILPKFSTIVNDTASIAPTTNSSTNHAVVPDLYAHNAPVDDAQRAWYKAISPVLFVAEANGDLSDLLPAQDDLPAASQVSTTSANDLLVVTPQMLIDYLKPNKNSTNGVNTTVLVPVDFKPPTTAAPQSSQAVYRTP